MHYYNPHYSSHFAIHKFVFCGSYKTTHIWVHKMMIKKTEFFDKNISDEYIRTYTVYIEHDGLLLQPSIVRFIMRICDCVRRCITLCHWQTMFQFQRNVSHKIHIKYGYTEYCSVFMLHALHIIQRYKTIILIISESHNKVSSQYTILSLSHSYTAFTAILVHHSVACRHVNMSMEIQTVTVTVTDRNSEQNKPKKTKSELIYGNAFPLWICDLKQ